VYALGHNTQTSILYFVPTNAGLHLSSYFVCFYKHVISLIHNQIAITKYTVGFPSVEHHRHQMRFFFFLIIQFLYFFLPKRALNTFYVGAD